MVGLEVAMLLAGRWFFGGCGVDRLPVAAVAVEAEAVAVKGTKVVKGGVEERDLRVALVLALAANRPTARIAGVRILYGTR
jgi:hypothetical protein